MSESAREFTVVLAHGPADATATLEVVAELRARRQPVTPVLIVDSDAPLLEACAKVGGRALFVIARGAALSAERVESLREVLRDLGVPMSRSLVLGLEPRAAKAFAERVITVLRRITPNAEAVRASTTGGPPPPPRPRSMTPVPQRAEHSSVAPSGYAVMPPSFDAEPREAPATAPGVASAAVVAVDAAALGRTPRSRRVAVAATALASAGVLAWALLPEHSEPARDATPAVDSVADTSRVADAPTAPPPTTPEPPSTAAEPPAAATTVALAPAEDAATPTTEDSEAIVAALREREIRALDVFVVAPEAKKPSNFAGATAYCASLRIAGIADWRLPDIGELLSMSRAKMLRKGSVWSATKGDTFGDLRLVLVIKRERISPIPGGWDGGRVICVRERG